MIIPCPYNSIYKYSLEFISLVDGDGNQQIWRYALDMGIVPIDMWFSEVLMALHGIQLSYIYIYIYISTHIDIYIDDDDDDFEQHQLFSQ